MSRWYTWIPPSFAVAWVLLPLAAVAVSATPVAPLQRACSIPPRSGEDITALLARTGVATPAATTEGRTLPAGTPTDAETDKAIDDVIETWLACQNAGEPLRAWSLFSDGYLYRLLSRQGGFSRESYAALATPAPAGEATARLLEIRDQRVLSDGRLGATVTIEYASVPMPKRFFFSFTRADGRLVIDGILGEISFSLP